MSRGHAPGPTNGAAVSHCDFHPVGCASVVLAAVRRALRRHAGGPVQMPVRGATVRAWPAEVAGVAPWRELGGEGAQLSGAVLAWAGNRGLLFGVGDGVGWFFADLEGQIPAVV